MCEGGYENVIDLLLHGWSGKQQKNSDTAVINTSECANACKNLPQSSFFIQTHEKAPVV